MRRNWLFRIRWTTGIVLLVLSLTICGSWIRSLTIVDQIEFEDGAQRTHQIVAVKGTISWCRWDRKHRQMIANQFVAKNFLERAKIDWQSAPLANTLFVHYHPLFRFSFWWPLGVTATLGPDTSRLSEGIWGPTMELRGHGVIIRHSTILMPLMLACGMLLLLPTRRRSQPEKAEPRNSQNLNSPSIS